MFRFAAVALVLGAAAVGPQQPPPGCSAWERRTEVIRLARSINTLENRTHDQANHFVALSELQVATPEGFDVQLSTDGVTYTFSIKDTTDPCHRAAFSDQIGVIYTAEPLR
jgi:hypothetical protein